jgi:hypothetical protein
MWLPALQFQRNFRILYFKKKLALPIPTFVAYLMKLKGAETKSE